MELKEAFIDKIICHHYSQDMYRCLLNNACMSVENLDSTVLKDFFIKPFSSQKGEYGFSHPVSLDYNIVFQSAVGLLENGDFVKCSQDIFRHLQSVSTLPTIKDGDIFVAKVEDIIMNDSYYEGLGIFKIESKSDFIETFVDSKGNMQFSLKSGFPSNRIDKACLIVFSSEKPICYLIDRSKDTKFWRQDFLGLVPRITDYTQSKSTLQMFKSFIEERLPDISKVTKAEQVNMINKCSELMKKTEMLNINDAAHSLFNDTKIVNQFAEYRKAFEQKENLTLQDSFGVDKKAVTVLKNARRIRLDDTAEIHLLKTGNFLERGYDDERGMYYYTLFFSKEK